MHFLLPQINVKPGKGKRLLELLDPLIDYTYNEKAAFAYYWFAKEDDKDAIWGIESYLQKSDLYEGHLKSAEFKTLADALGKEDLPRAELSLTDALPSHGFLTRKGQECPSGTFVWLVELTAKSSAGRDEILNLSKPLVEYVQANEEKTLSYLFLKDEKDDKKIWIFEMYETKEALTTIHHKSEAFSTFGGQLREKDLVADKKNTGLIALGKGFLGKDGQHINF